jgi:hypothetical protein
MTDQEALTALNTDYINAVQNGDVKRFDEILAEEFYASNPDGSLVDRAGFLAQTKAARRRDATPTFGPNAAASGARSQRTSHAVDNCAARSE